MRTVAPLAVLLAGPILAGFADACVNDRDTLIRETQSPPSVLTALTGRFERLPPAYYQARVDRIRKIARPTPEDLDDLGAALDRLGRSREGYEVMRRKAAMPGLSREQRYRLYANRGTFLAHSVLVSNAPAEALKPAITDIAESIRIKPNAHFGREGVQLRVLKWIYAHRTDPKTQNLGVVLEKEGDPVKTATALAGLIELGNAWESPDVVAAIGHLMPDLDASKTRTGTGGHGVQTFRRSAVYARLRYDELKSKGRKPLDPSADENQGKSDYGLPVQEFARVEDDWKRERAAAEDRTRLRAAYVESRIAAGRHPDTDPGFYSEWREPTSAPTAPFPDRTIVHGGETPAEIGERVLRALVVALIVGILAVVLVVRAVRRRRSRRLLLN